MNCLEMIFKDPITILVYLSTLIFISPELTTFVIIIPITGITCLIIGRSLKKSSDRGQNKMEEFFLLSKKIFLV